ncbi:MAG: alpha/beta fold hydrolase [Candidatus Marinamargulisbacteria bacterium]
MTMLHHHTQGDPSATPIILIHGLFGDGQNLLGLAKGLTDYFVIMPDCRNHGQSFHHSNMSYPTMANDIINLMNNYQCSTPIVIGHSMGGKIAMALALQHPNIIQKLVIMDIAPKQYPPHHLSIIQALQQLDLASFTSKTEAITALAPSIPNAGLRQFLAKNIARVDGQLCWKINLPAIADQYNIISGFPVQSNNCQISTLFIRGTQSNYIEKNDESNIQKLFPKSTFIDIEASHWVHAEKPDQTISTIKHFLKITD